MKNQTLIERVLLLKLRDEKWYNCFFFFFTVSSTLHIS